MKNGKRNSRSRSKAPTLKSKHRILPAGIVVGVLLCGAIAAVVQHSGRSDSHAATNTLQSAVSYAQSQGVDAGVAVYDMQAKKLYSAGNAAGYYGSASVMKLFVATNLLVTGQMTGTKKTTAYKMITQSDDASLEALLPYVGGTNVVTWAAQHYNIPNLGTPPTKAGCWGNTHITANGLALFLNAVQNDSKVSSWLVNAMSHYSPVASDGTNQTFGIPSSAPKAAIKQGWGVCSSITNGTVINSTGIVTNKTGLTQNRYAVVILTNTNKWSANSNAFNSTQAGVVTKMAATILPGGKVTLP